MVTEGCSLVRNIILARFLTKADFGSGRTSRHLVLTLFGFQASWP